MISPPILFRSIRTGFVDHPCIFSSLGDANGAMYLLGTNFGALSWSNPYTAGRIGIIISSNSGGGFEESLVDRNTVGGYSTSNLVDSNVIFDFGVNQMSVNEFALGPRAVSSSLHMPVTWTLDGSPDASTWTNIYTGSSTPPGWSAGSLSGYSVSSTPFYRYLRWMQTGVNSLGAYYFCPGEFEVYGTLRSPP